MWILERRDFLRLSAGALAGLMTGCAGWTSRRFGGARFGIVTDSHYADADPGGTRYYRESLGKMREAVDRLNEENLAFLVHLGDMKDMAAGESDEATLAHLIRIEAEIQRFDGPALHVLGNHDMDNLSKQQAISALTDARGDGQSYGAWSRAGLRMVVLDANFHADGSDYDHGNFDWREINIPAEQIDWLERELTAAAEPVIVFCHQRLDGSGNVFVNNAADVRDVIEASDKVLAVFHGHDHAGAHNTLGGVHYYTLKAMVEGSGAENNSYAVVEVLPTLDIEVLGYRRAVGLQMPHATEPVA